LVESFLLAVPGTLVGVGIAWPTVTFISSLELPTERPIAITPAIDYRVLLFTLAVLALATVATGLVPALRTSSRDPIEVFRDTSESSQQRLQKLLVIAQVALSVLLVLVASFFIESLSNAKSVDLGFQPDRLAMASVDPSLRGYGTDRGTRFFEELRERLSRNPAFESAARASSVPLSFNIVRTSVSREYPDALTRSPRLSVDVAGVDEHYFRTMGIPLLFGRFFEPDDRAGDSRAVVINRALANTLWPDGKAVNQRLFVGDGEARQVVGVVETGKYLSPGEEPTPFLYFPLPKAANLRASTIVVKPNTNVAAPDALSTLTRVVRELDPDVTIYDAKTMEEHLSLSFLPARASATVAGFFGVAALVLAVAGLYGLLAQWVTERTREIGIRRALGAETVAVLGLFLRRGLAMVLSGLVLGLPAALALSSATRGAFHGAPASDPKTWGSAIALLLIVSVFACWLPARHATRVAPREALRHE
jgi:predicted permease